MPEKISFVKASDKLNSSYIPLQKVIHIASRHRAAIFPIKGDCMEGVDIQDGGKVAVDFTHYPRPGRKENGKYIDGDPCMCYASVPRADDGPPHPPAVLCKTYVGLWALGHMVGTRYKQTPGELYRMNGAFNAIAILGVVFASWDRDGNLLWERDPNEYPTELPQRFTIKGGNVDIDAIIVPD